MSGLLIMLWAIAGVAALAWYGLRGSPNEEPELGHNSPYPRSILPPVMFQGQVESEEDDGKPLEV